VCNSDFCSFGNDVFGDCEMKFQLAPLNRTFVFAIFELTQAPIAFLVRSPCPGNACVVSLNPSINANQCPQILIALVNFPEQDTKARF
jgi:hypothetical protein